MSYIVNRDMKCCRDCRACRIVLLMTIELESTTERSVNALVGERVHQALWRRKITQTQFAPMLGVTQSALSRKMRGERAFGVDELLDISEYLDIPITDLLPKRKDPHPDGPDGGSTSRLRESNSRPFHYLSDEPASIVDLFPAVEDDAEAA